MLENWRLADVSFLQCDNVYIHFLLNVGENPRNDSTICLYVSDKKTYHLSFVNCEIFPLNFREGRLWKPN